MIMDEILFTVATYFIGMGMGYLACITKLK